jgi:hypothetical protein
VIRNQNALRRMLYRVAQKLLRTRCQPVSSCVKWPLHHPVYNIGLIEGLSVTTIVVGKFWHWNSSGPYTSHKLLAWWIRLGVQHACRYPYTLSPYEPLKEKDHSENLDINGSIILKQALAKQYELDASEWYTDRWRAVVNISSVPKFSKNLRATSKFWAA